MANPHTIAVAGKGGVGKTTTCGMLIDYLCKKNKGPVLVVDADANSNLNEVLGEYHIREYCWACRSGRGLLRRWRSCHLPPLSLSGQSGYIVQLWQA